MKYIIVAYDRNRAIGAKGELPWEGQMKNDMQRVRELTTGNAIIMGRTTYDSIGHALPNRQNIVITHRPFEAKDVTVVSTLNDAYAAVGPGKDAYIFGGGQIYALALDTVDEIITTEIDTIIDDGDAFFPELDQSVWREASREGHQNDDKNKYDYAFVTYKRVK